MHQKNYLARSMRRQLVLAKSSAPLREAASIQLDGNHEISSQTPYMLLGQHIFLYWRKPHQASSLHIEMHTDLHFPCRIRRCSMSSRAFSPSLHLLSNSSRVPNMLSYIFFSMCMTYKLCLMSKEDQ